MILRVPVLPVQVLSDSHSGVLKLAAGFSDSLLSLQRETESLRRLNSDLQRDTKSTGNTHLKHTPETHTH